MVDDVLPVFRTHHAMSLNKRCVQSEHQRKKALQEFGVAISHEQRFMTYAAHSGWGNQKIELTNAIHLAHNLNRTLILPPVLKHFSAGKNPDPTKAAALYRSMAPYVAMTTQFSFRHLEELSMKFVDFADFDRANPDFEKRADTSMCSQQELLAFRRSRPKAIQEEADKTGMGWLAFAGFRQDARVLMWPSMFMSPATPSPDDLPCGAAAFYRAHVVPPAGPLLRGAFKASSGMAPYYATHLRAGDGSTPTSAPGDAKCFADMIDWSLHYMSMDEVEKPAGRPATSFFLATDRDAKVVKQALPQTRLGGRFPTYDLHNLTHSVDGRRAELRDYLAQTSAASFYEVLMDYAVVGLADDVYLPHYAFQSPFMASTMSLAMDLLWTAVHATRFAEIEPSPKSWHSWRTSSLLQRHRKPMQLELGLHLAGRCETHEACSTLALSIWRAAPAQPRKEPSAVEPDVAKQINGCTERNFDNLASVKGSLESMVAAHGCSNGSRLAKSLEKVQKAEQSISKLKSRQAELTKKGYV